MPESLVKLAAIFDLFELILRHDRDFKKTKILTNSNCGQLCNPLIIFTLIGAVDKKVVGDSVELFKDLQHLVKPVTMEEVKSAIFEQGSGKSPGPDGYTPHFFTSAWSVVWDDVFAAVQYF